MAQRYADDAFLISRVPAASAVDSAARLAALEDAEPMIDLAVYRARAELAHAYYAAHLLALRYPSLLGGESGVVTSKSAGEVSVGYAAPVLTGDETDVARTYYGRQYAELRRIAGAGVRVVG